MMDLNEILVFCKVVRAGSFIGASRELRMPRSTVSRKVAELEAQLGATLLHRTTRKIGLTDAGRAFYRHAERVVTEIEHAELAVSRLQAIPRGVLHVTTPLNMSFLDSIIASFLARYPEVDLRMTATDRVVDLIEDGFDVGIRAGRLSDSSLIARKLGVLRSVIVASPEFLKRNGRPEVPLDLETLDCLLFSGSAAQARWTLTHKGKTVVITVKARLVVNDLNLLIETACSGLGIALLPLHRCQEELGQRQLIRVMNAWSSGDAPLHALYPSARHLSPKVKAFLDHVREHMTPPPWELQGDIRDVR